MVKWQKRVDLSSRQIQNEESSGAAKEIIHLSSMDMEILLAISRRGELALQNNPAGWYRLQQISRVLVSDAEYRQLFRNVLMQPVQLTKNTLL